MQLQPKQTHEDLMTPSWPNDICEHDPIQNMRYYLIEFKFRYLHSRIYKHCNGPKII